MGAGSQHQKITGRDRFLVFSEDDRPWIVELWLAIEPLTWYGNQSQSDIDEVSNASIPTLAQIADMYATLYLKSRRRRNRKKVRELYDRMQTALAKYEG